MPIGVNLSLKALINVAFTIVSIPLNPLRRGTLKRLLSPLLKLCLIRIFLNNPESFVNQGFWEQSRHKR